MMRDELTPYLEVSMENWDALGHPYEVLTPDEVRYPLARDPYAGDPSLRVRALAAGVVRARRAIESVARVFEREGGEIRIARASMGSRDGGTLSDIELEGGERLSADTYVIAVGPWFKKFLPEFMEAAVHVERDRARLLHGDRPRATSRSVSRTCRATTCPRRRGGPCFPG